MRTATRPDKSIMSNRMRKVALWRLLLGLTVILAMVVLPVACTKDSTSSGNSTSAQLEEALASGKPTLVGFVGKACTCKNIIPSLKELASAYEGKCNIVILDQDGNKNLFSRYNITLVPTQVYFDSSGAEVDRVTGPSTKEEIIERLKGMGVP